MSNDIERAHASWSKCGGKLHVKSFTIF